MINEIRQQTCIYWNCNT